MGTVPGQLGKNIVVENSLAIRYPKIDPRRDKNNDSGNVSGQYSNAVDPGAIITGGTNVISDILGYATGSTQQQIANQQLAAQAALAQAQAQQMAAQRKGPNVPLILGIGGGVVIVTVAVIMYFKYGRKKS